MREDSVDHRTRPRDTRLEGQGLMQSYRRLESNCLLGAALVLGLAFGCGCSGGMSSLSKSSSAKTKLESTKPIQVNSQFETELKTIGWPSAREFSKLYAPNGTSAINWDPTSCKSWADFNRAPTVGRDGHPKPDFRLNPKETDALKRNGFVVSERLGRTTFTNLLYDVYHADLPIFISADCALLAWHQSYDNACQSTERSILAPLLKECLTHMHDGISDLLRYEPELAESVRDADYILTVAISLLNTGQVASKLGQDTRASQTLEWCRTLQPQNVSLYGEEKRLVDFSRIKARGKYAGDPNLEPYFQAVMWIRLANLRISDSSNSKREWATSLVLADLLRRSQQIDQANQIDQILQNLVGPTDGLSIVQLTAWLKGRSIHDPQALHQELMKTPLGIEQIPSAGVEAESSVRSKVENPRRFFLTGARYTIDSWALGKMVFPGVEGPKSRVNRRVPSGLDLGFSVFANNAATPELVQRIENKAGVPFRDGLPFQQNLVAVRRALDSQPPEVWDSCIPTLWLQCLRVLSEPVKGQLPQSMQTRAWADKTLNTQLASWTQLRHDIILDAKDSETGGMVCGYPTGYVEPRPDFWQVMKEMAERMATLYESIPRSEYDRHKYFAKFYRNFAVQMDKIKSIADAELAGKPLTSAQLNFLKDTIEQGQPDCGQRAYSGWYFTLFPHDGDDPEIWSPPVADVHTNPPEAEDPGSVLHEANGQADMLIVAIDSGSDKMLFAGPTLSHYEWSESKRLSDSEWKERVKLQKRPARPPWTKSYLVLK